VINSLTVPLKDQEDERLASRRSKKSADDRKGVLIRVRPQAWKAMRQLALDREITLQGLLVEALNDVFQKHGRPPIA
jgi:hypothetical protein